MTYPACIVSRARIQFYQPSLKNKKTKKVRLIMLKDATVLRQPILDNSMTIIGYELLLQPVDSNAAVNMDTLKQIHATFDLTQLSGGVKLFLRSNQVSLSEELLSLYPTPTQLSIEVDQQVAHDVKQLKLLKVLRQGGITLTLGDYQPDAEHDRIAAACQLVKINTTIFSDDQLSDMVAKLHQAGHKVIASNVPDETDFQRLKALKFDYFQGFFFTNPIVLHGKKLSASKLNLLQLLAKVNNDETDLEALAEVIGHDVALSHKLLTAINHPQHNLPVQVTSIVDAIRYMGLKRLKLWTSMILMAEVDEKPQALMETSLIRAKFCEALAEHTGHKAEKDSFFLVGLFSTLGAYFNLPQDEVLGELPLAEHLKEAMLEHNGAVGKALWIAKQFENPYTDLMSLQYEDAGFMDISNRYMDATRWGSAIMRSTQ